MYIKNKFSVNSTTNREATVLCFNFEVLTAVLICICVVRPFLKYTARLAHTVLVL